MPSTPPPVPANPALYARVKREADAVFLAPTSAYKSGWIVRTYKERGGTYKTPPTSVKSTIHTPTGLTRWFAEKWVNLNAPSSPCGREHATHNGKYPLCRPSVRITAETPRTTKELSPASIKKANKEKQKVKERGRVRFTP